MCMICEGQAGGFILNFWFEEKGFGACVYKFP